MAQGDCPGGIIPPGSSLLLVLPNGRGRAPILSWDLPFNYRCDLEPQDYPPPGGPQLLVGPYSGIPVTDYVDNRRVTVDIDAPATAVAGSIMHYRIRTHVAGEVDLGVVGCPNYTEQLASATEGHQLNCNGIGDIPERQALVDQWFDMAMLIPINSPTGDQDLSWKLDPPFHAASNTRLQIRTR